MRGVIPPLPNTPSWRGAELKHRDNFTFYTELEDHIISGASIAPTSEVYMTAMLVLLIGNKYKGGVACRGIKFYENPSIASRVIRNGRRDTRAWLYKPTVSPYCRTKTKFLSSLSAAECQMGSETFLDMLTCQFVRYFKREEIV